MTNWLKQLLESAQQITKSKAPWLDGYSQILIYGTGTFAQDIHRVLTDQGLPVRGFVDHLERKSPYLNGIPVFKPEVIKDFGKPIYNTVVVLGIHNYLANIPQIILQLKKYGVEQIVSSIELYDFFGKELGERYWLTSRNFYSSLEYVLEELLNLWIDETSKVLFRQILEFRIHGDASQLSQPDLLNPYHPRDIPPWETPLRFVDCGAFDGDTIADFIRNDIKIEAVAAFEPDLFNFNKLASFVKSNHKKLPNANLWPCGVFSSNKQLKFEAGQEMASSISSTGSTMVQCVTLDDALSTFRPNLIKMDIEGSEYDALLGAHDLIANFQPGLAISLYHRPEHLWQLPFLIKRMVPDKTYQFMMRSHALNDFELVLYAIPQKRF
jgi:FkbM family methyltransferase